eukprot:scaffold186148_cov27-Tisochrysis_lutea.AAC.2
MGRAHARQPFWPIVLQTLQHVRELGGGQVGQLEERGEKVEEDGGRSDRQDHVSDDVVLVGCGDLALELVDLEGILLDLLALVALKARLGHALGLHLAHGLSRVDPVILARLLLRLERVARVGRNDGVRDGLPRTWHKWHELVLLWLGGADLA